MRIPTEIAQDLLRSSEGWLGVNHPVLTAHRRSSRRNCFGSANAAAGPTQRSCWRRWRRFKPARNLPRNTRLRTFTGRKKG
jgi:hypothetical protein